MKRGEDEVRLSGEVWTVTAVEYAKLVRLDPELCFLTGAKFLNLNQWRVESLIPF